MQKRWLVKRRQLVLEATTYTTYKDIWAAAIGEVLVCSRSQPTRKSFRCKTIFVSNIFVRFLCPKIFLQRTKSELQYVWRVQNAIPMPSYSRVNHRGAYNSIPLLNPETGVISPAPRL